MKESVRQRLELTAKKAAVRAILEDLGLPEKNIKSILAESNSEPGAGQINWKLPAK